MFCYGTFFSLSSCFYCFTYYLYGDFYSVYLSIDLPTYLPTGQLTYRPTLILLSLLGISACTLSMNQKKELKSHNNNAAFNASSQASLQMGPQVHPTFLECTCDSLELSVPPFSDAAVSPPRAHPPSSATQSTFTVTACNISP